MFKRALARIRWIFQTGNGRPAALALLLGLLVIAQFPEQSPFKLARLALFDRYQTVLPRERLSAPVTIVDIDEASLKKFGQWPWPRDRTAELLRKVTALGPLAIGVDIYMPERDQTSPARLAERLTPQQESLRRALNALADHDAVLAEAIAAGPTVLGAAGFEVETLTTSRGLRITPVQSEGGNALDYVRRYPFVLASLPEFQARAAGQALLSVDLQGAVVRRIPLVLGVGDQLVPSLAMEMLRVATGSPAIQAHVGALGIDTISVADLSVRTQPEGDVWLHFGKSDPARYVSAAAVLEGKVPEEMIRNKLVLVGLSGFGLVDNRLTPLGEQVPGVDIQAQLLESLFDGDTLRRPRWIGWIETLMLAAGGLFLIWAVPALRARLASLLATILFVVLFGSGFATFYFGGLLLDAAGVFASLNVVFGSLLGSAFIESDRKRRIAEAALHRERESAAEVAGELAAARRIQLGTLPNADLLFAHEQRFQVAALLEPAREVGGDLYDFFMLDEHRLFFVVGDVSGKGVPASLFMAVAKALGKSIALRGTEGAGSIVSAMNQELARDNPELLFVTMVAGVLDASNGDLEICSAGHDAPRLLHASGEPVVSLITGEGGPPLCMIANFPYPSVWLRLAPGDGLCVITDGVTEAMNGAHSAYGPQRLDALLARQGRAAPPAALAGAVREDVRAFVGTAEPSDDLTLLALRWHGNALNAR